MIAPKNIYSEREPEKKLIGGLYPFFLLSLILFFHDSHQHFKHPHVVPDIINLIFLYLHLPSLQSISLSLYGVAMGVLMSKKQQVEKVQKCSAVVSAFREGLKNQPSTGQAQNNTESKDEALNEPESDASGRKEEDGKPGPSTAPPKEENKANQEAWGRLRDGKGVEPEELNKVHQLTPPAFIRPKRQPNDDQPIQIQLEQREQVRLYK